MRSTPTMSPHRHAEHSKPRFSVSTRNSYLATERPAARHAGQMKSRDRTLTLRWSAVCGARGSGGAAPLARAHAPAPAAP